MIVVTGGAGFIGSALVWRLNLIGLTDIMVVDELGCDLRWKNLVGLRFADYLDKADFMALLKQNRLPAIRAIVHMGACSATTEKNASYLMENNYHYSRALAEYALDKGIRYIQASSAATYGDGALGFDDAHERLPRLRPLNMYGYSKHLFDLWALDNNLLDKLVCVKFFNVFGPNEYHKDDMRSLVCKAYHQITASGRISLFKSDRPDYQDGGQQRDFVYVKDCLNVLTWFLEHPEANGVYNLGTGTARTWNDLAAGIFSALNLPVNIEYIDMPASLKGRYQYHTQADMAKLVQAGYTREFYTLEEAVADYTVKYLAAGEKYLTEVSPT